MTKYRILKVTEDDYDKVKRAFGRTSHPEYAVCGFVDLELAPPKHWQEAMCTKVCTKRLYPKGNEIPTSFHHLSQEKKQ